jgi:UDP-N-acetylglucosamine diphosphorylase / glucose-1-phosphate thymidylyltransferase / UDP-N-acetylgalactosamine diphosphorylase / glucosamine-1-phosphate N-acetyltransferase / galactosamine-1-phosphate N-acetyltransferase
MTDEFFDLTSFSHASLWKKGEMPWYPLHILESYIGMGNIKIVIPEGVFLASPERISIDEGTEIEPGVFIQGPCIIGKRCKIRHGAYLRGPLVLGDDCHIGHAAELKNSILLNHAYATHFTYVGDSIVGGFANLGAGVKCANLRLDRKEVTVRFGEQKMGTGLKKFGALIGDRVQIGCNSVLNPGTCIGMDSIAHALSNISGYIPKGSQINAKGVGWTSELA